MSGLRVVVATDAIGALDSHAAGVAIARGWSDRAQVAVVPLAERGVALGGALAALLDGDLVVEADGWWLRAGDTLAVGLTAGEPDPWNLEASSTRLGEWLADGLRAGTPQRLILDLTGQPALDGGAGLLAALGAAATGQLDGGVAGLAEIDSLDLAAVRYQLADVELFGVVDDDETDLGLLGLRGAVARRGYQAGIDPAGVLAAEATLTRWLSVLGLPDAPAAGAAGGVAAAVLALGGRVSRGAALCAELAGLERTLRLADVVVTGCDAVHIGNYGGPLVRFIADLATAAERPCLLVTPELSVGRRELRTFGVETGVVAAGPTPQALTAAAARLAGGWRGLAAPRVDLPS